MHDIYLVTVLRTAIKVQALNFVICTVFKHDQKYFFLEGLLSLVFVIVNHILIQKLQQVLDKLSIQFFECVCQSKLNYILLCMFIMLFKKFQLFILTIVFVCKARIYCKTLIKIVEFYRATYIYTLLLSEQFFFL